MSMAFLPIEAITDRRQLAASMASCKGELT